MQRDVAVREVMDDAYVGVSEADGVLDTVELLVEQGQSIAVVLQGADVVGIDTELTPELLKEGLARDLVRRIQDARKNAGFEIQDRISLSYQAGPRLNQVLDELGDYIASEVLAVEMKPGAPAESAYTESFELDGENVTIALERVS